MGQSEYRNTCKGNFQEMCTQVNGLAVTAEIFNRAPLLREGSSFDLSKWGQIHCSQGRVEEVVTPL